MNNDKKVIISKDLTEFFKEEVSLAKNDLGVKLSDLIEYYIVHLLCDFSYFKPDNNKQKSPGAEPLALIYQRANQASADERLAVLKELGDVALYISGFFTDFIDKSLVDVDYYIAMGGNAYSSLSHLVGQKRHGQTFADLYGQLSVNFIDLVDVLNQIATRAQDKSVIDNADLLRLYDRWARTGSKRIHKLLLGRGLLTGFYIPTDYIQ